MDAEFVRQEFKAKGYNVSKTAASLGLDYHQLRDTFGVKLAPIVRPTGRMPSDISTLGKPGMKSYVVAVKANGDGWPMRFHNALQEAHTKYDAGTHEMCQEKRSDGWVVQYLIPRKVPRARSHMFDMTWGRL